MKYNTSYKIISFLLFIILLTSCGFKGPLYLEDKKETTDSKKGANKPTNESATK